MRYLSEETMLTGQHRKKKKREKRKGKPVEKKKQQHANKTKINFLLCSTYLKFANVVF